MDTASFIVLPFALLALLSPVSKAQDCIHVTHPSNQEAIVGGNVSLSCEASGGQFDQWLHNDQPVTSGGDYRITSTATGSTLEITSFRKELAGEYRCQFSSDHGSILTLPRKVKYFGSQQFDEHPTDFDSYLLNPTADRLNKKYREVIALECTLQYHPYILPPVITWQWCHENGSYEDVKPNAPLFGEPQVPSYVFFQTNLTGYFQIIASNDSIYDGSRFRCKAKSSIPGDNQEVHSNCARITQHPPAPLVDVVFVLDASASIKCPDHKRVIDFISTLIENIMQRSSLPKVGVIKFAKVPTVIKQFTDPFSRENLTKSACVGITMGNKLPKALRVAHSLIRDASDKTSRGNYRPFVIVFTDGRLGNIEGINKTAKMLKKDDITLYAIGVGENIKATTLNVIAQGRQDRVFNATFEALKELNTTITEKLLEDIEVPENIPTFSTVPKRHINLVENETGFMACTIQKSTPSSLSVKDSSGVEISEVYNAHSETHLPYRLIGEHNLQVDSLKVSENTTTLDFTCSVTSITHHTTFHIHRPLVTLKNELCIRHVINEGFPFRLLLELKGVHYHNIFRVFRDGNLVHSNNDCHPAERMDKCVHVFLVNRSAVQNDSGIYQMEVENLAGTVVQYHYVQVNSTSSTTNLPSPPSPTTSSPSPSSISSSPITTSSPSPSSISSSPITTSSPSPSTSISSSPITTSSPSPSTSISSSPITTSSPSPSSISSSPVTTSSPSPSPSISSSPITTSSPSPSSSISSSPVTTSSPSPSSSISSSPVTTSSPSPPSSISSSPISTFSPSPSSSISSSPITSSSPSPSSISSFSIINFYTPSPTLGIPIPVTTDGGFPGWAIFLIVFFILLFILLLLILVCLFLFYREKANDQGVYNAEKRELEYNKEFDAYRS